jgi:PEP-CTERM/exosortase A-associated glycosyltransferase
MKVLHALDHSLPHRSGYSFRSRSILQFQRGCGLEPVVLTSPKHGESAGPREEIDGLVYHRTGPAEAGLTGSVGRVPVLRERRQMRAMRRRMVDLGRAERVELIHAHSPWLNGVPARSAARGLRVPVVYEIRAFWEDAAVDHGTCREGSLRYRLSRFMEGRLVRRVDAVVAICEGLRKDLVARGVSPEMIFVVPNGVDLERFTPCEPDVELLDRYGLRGKKVLGFLGSFYGYEGLSLLLEAMARLRETGPDVRLLLVGGGPEESRLKARAQELGLSSVVFAGSVPPAGVRSHYSIMNALVYPRLSERITELVTPLKPLEVMAMGKVVIGSDVGGIKELVSDGTNGFLFRAGSADDLVRTVLRVLEGEEGVARVGVQAREAVRHCRDWAKIVSRYPEIYREAKARAGAR